MMPLLDPTHEAAVRARLPALWILWAAFLSSPLVVALIVYAGFLPAAETALAPPLVSVVLAVYAAGVLALSLWVRFRVPARMLRQPAGDLQAFLIRYQSVLILAFALAESSAIVGLVLLFLGSVAAVCWGFILASLVVLLLEAPRGGEVAGLVEEAARRHPGAL